MTVRASLAALALLSSLAAGCFGPSLGDEPFLCGSVEPVCPPGYSCNAARRCVHGAGIDGGRADAPITIDGGGDAPTSDAPTSDAPTSDAPRIDAPRPDAPGIDAPPCMVHCEGDTLVTCDGPTPTLTSCAAGCDPQGVPPSCFLLAPQLLPATTCREPAIAPPNFGSNVVRISTDDCQGGDVKQQANGAPDLCVFHYASLNVPALTTLRLEGSRIPVFVTLGNMVILGKIDGSGDLGAGGAGSAIGAPEQGGEGMAMAPPGGGGGGASTAGGAGGPSLNGITDGGKPGPPHASTPELRAGGFGGPGGDRCGFAGCPNHGGGGGGALYLIACGTLSIGPAAVIDVSGGGGPGGEAGTTQQSAGGGDGGGAGGDILAEASQILISAGAAVGANGGGGGGGGERGTDLVNGADGKPGADGSPTTTPAGGGGAPTGGGAGGNGATGATAGRLPQPGLMPTGTGGAGGGGGAAGRIRALSRPDRPITLPGGTTVSPPPTLGAIGRTH